LQPHLEAYLDAYISAAGLAGDLVREVGLGN
jgi:hypothetical protein